MVIKRMVSKPAHPILTINSGPSSVKFAAFRLAESLVHVLTGRVERIGFPGASLTIDDVLTKKRQGKIKPWKRRKIR
jgi:acetate kinase